MPTVTDSRRKNGKPTRTVFGLLAIIWHVWLAESEARAEGMAKGMEKGRAEGRAEGSNQANINAAQRMLADGMSKELVMKYTGLSPEQISKIN